MQRQQYLLILVALSIILCSQLTLADQYYDPYAYYDPLRAGQPIEPISCQPVAGYPIYGLFWDGQKCDSCANEYCTCSTYRGCAGCQYGYGLFDTINGCMPCVGNSQSRSSGGYYNNGVVSCCFSQTRMSATQCDDNSTSKFYLSNNNNQIWTKFGGYCYSLSNCLRYTEYGTCSVCQPGYYEVNDQKTCIQCDIANCSTCEGPQTCRSCMQGFYLGYINVYTRSLACLNCSSSVCQCNNNSTACIACTDAAKLNGYYFDTNQSNCVQCFPLDASKQLGCYKCAGSNNCESTGCYPEYIFTSQNGSGFCIKCLDYCHSCKLKPNTTNSTVCDSLSCYNGYYYNSADGTCQPCDYQNGVGRCSSFKVPTQCIHANTTGVSFHNSHQNFYYLMTWTDSNNTLQKQCKQNLNNCKSMRMPTNSSIPVCASCYDDLGYQLLSFNNSGCYFCNDPVKGVPNCIKCIDPGNVAKFVCQQCQTGQDVSAWSNGTADVSNFFLNTNSSMCQECSKGCMSCDNANTCKQCQTTFRFDNTSSTCTRCLTNCAVCSSTNGTSCDRCMPYTRRVQVQNGTWVCERCTSHCMNCDSGRSYCSQCEAGYYLISGSCNPARANCISYSTNGECSVCDYGFRLLGGWCYPCAAPGYINCYDFCSSTYYVRDGDVLTAAYQQNKTKPIDGKLLIYSLLLLVILCAGVIF